MGECVVVLGSGRSGTSMVTGLLSEAGLRMSDDLIEASVQNPKGSYEDRQIFETERDLLLQLGPLTVPPPQGWLDGPAVSAAETRLREVVDYQVARDDSIWGFKSPNTAFALPLWSRIFNASKIVPRHVLCVREPSAVVVSLMRNYNVDASVGELLWLTKNLAAILNTGADIFIAHYERIVEGDFDHIADLVSYAGLGDESDRKRLESFIKSTLNRSSVNAYSCRNPAVGKLYDVIKDCMGCGFDHRSLVDVAIEVEAEIDPYKGWLKEVHRTYRNRPAVPPANRAAPPELAELRKAVDARDKEIAGLGKAVDARDKEIAGLSKEIAGLGKAADARDKEIAGLGKVADARDKEIAELKQERCNLVAEAARRDQRTVLAAHEIERLRTFCINTDRRFTDILGTHEKTGANLPNRLANVKLEGAEKPNRREEKLKAELIRTRGSASFQIGNILVKGVRSPGWNTLAIPWRLLKLVLARRSKRRHRA